MVQKEYAEKGLKYFVVSIYHITFASVKTRISLFYKNKGNLFTLYYKPKPLSDAQLGRFVCFGGQKL